MSNASLGVIDSARRILVKRRLRGIDTVEIELDERAALDSDELVVENTLYLPYVDADAPLAFLLEQTGREDDEKQHDMSVSGRTLDGIALDGRVAHPDPTNWPTDAAGHDEQAAVPAETAIKHYVEKNAGPTAHADRKVPGFAVATDGAGGSTVSYAARYESVLKAVLEICYAADLGWKVTYEAGTGLHTFEIIEPVDRSASVIFDFEFDSLEKFEQVESLLDSRNIAIVAGQGELAARDVAIRGTATGLQRREAFVDARDIELGATTLLQQRGDAFLAASTPTKSIVATPRQFGPFQYTRDFHLGDYVKVRNYQRSEDFNAQIIEVWITIEKSASVPQVVCVLDRAMPTLQSRVSGSPVTGARVDQAAGGAVIDYAEDADISTQAFGDAPAAGASVTEVAGANHKHGMPANPVTAHEAAATSHLAPQQHATNGTNAGYYVKIATGQFTAQYQSASATFDLFPTISPGGVGYAAHCAVRVYQGNAMGSQPIVNVVAHSLLGFAASDVSVVVTNVVTTTDFEVWVQLPANYIILGVKPIGSGGGVPFTWLSNQTPVVARSAGTAYGGIATVHELSTAAHAHSSLSGIGAADHHAAPVAGPDADVTIDAAGAAGTAGAFARSAHGHKLSTSATAAVAIGTAAAGTSGHAPSRDNHVHPTGAGTPSTQAFGDAAATGSGPAAAMTDHKHGMPANPVTAHEAAGDPHTGYRLESADHTHATTGLQGGTVAHSVLTGISENDHGRWTAIITKPADESVASSTAVQNDDDFFFTTVDLAIYEVEIIIAYVNAAGATPDIKLDFGEDANTRGALTGVGVSTADAASSQTVLTDQTSTMTFGTATGVRAIRIVGAFRGAGGTWRVRWAQNTSNATATKVLTGSVMRYRRVV